MTVCVTLYGIYTKKEVKRHESVVKFHIRIVRATYQEIQKIIYFMKALCLHIKKCICDRHIFIAYLVLLLLLLWGRKRNWKENNIRSQEMYVRKFIGDVWEVLRLERRYRNSFRKPQNKIKCKVSIWTKFEKSLTNFIV